MTHSAPEAVLDAQLVFENRQQAERHVTKAVVRLRQPRPDAQALKIEVQGERIERIEVWPTGAELAVMSLEEQLKLPASAVVRIRPPLAGAYDVTVYSTAPDAVRLNLELE